MYSNYTKGQLAVLKVQERALELSIHVCIPTVECRFDVVLVNTIGQCHRVQVKYADFTRNDGSVYIDFRKETRRNGKVKLYTTDEIDAVIAYLPKTGQCVWLPPEVFHKKASTTLRFTPSKNNQTKRVRLVSDYIW